MARKFRTETNMLCDCGSGLPVLTHSRMCAACERYNAAVAAQKAAAESLAKTRCREHVPGGAWLNSFGCFAATSSVSGIQVATAEEVAPFVALTTEARRNPAALKQHGAPINARATSLEPDPWELLRELLTRIEEAVRGVTVGTIRSTETYYTARDALEQHDAERRSDGT